MLVLSEQQVSELNEAVIVNANDYDAIGAGLKKALDMLMKRRLPVTKSCIND